MGNSRIAGVLVTAFLGCMIVAGSGCSSSARSFAVINELSPDVQAFRARNRRIIAQLEPEMPVEEFRKLWAAESDTLISASASGGQDPDKSAAGAAAKIDLSNPHTSESRIIWTKGISVIQWYYTDLVKNDGRVTEEELTPVVFLDGKVVGWGRRFLRQFDEYIEKTQKQEGSETH